MQVTRAQSQFLRFFLSGPPDRSYWLRDGKRFGRVAEPFALVPDASHVLVYRLADGDGDALPGEAIDRARLAVSDLQHLGPCWSEPLRTLSPLGQRLARTRLEKRAAVCAFRLTETKRDLLLQTASLVGLSPGVIVADLVAEYLESRSRSEATHAAPSSDQGETCE